jgi:ABC-2 type transport system permease protein
MLVRTEWRLLAREPMALFFGVAFPIVLLVVLGMASGAPQRDLGGLTLVQAYVPVVLVFTLAMFAVSVLPTALATYREKRWLRRLATTPVRPARMLGAQAAVQLGLAVGVCAVLLAVARIAFGVALPAQGLGFLLAFVLTGVALAGIGLLVAAVAPTARSANAMTTLLWFVLMFFAGLWVPREAMGSVLRGVSDATPLGAGVAALQDAAGGAFPSALHLLVLAAWSVLAWGAASRLFRWE